MHLSIVKKIGVGNLGQLLGIIALLFAFWGTNESFISIQSQVERSAENTGKQIKQISAEFDIAFKELAAHATKAGAGKEIDTAYTAAKERLDKVTQKLLTSQKSEMGEVNTLVDEAINTGWFTMTGRTVWQILVLLYFLFIAKYSLGDPLKRITDAANRLAENDLDVDIPETSREDEVGKMARAVDVFKTNAIETHRLRADRNVEQMKAKETIKNNMLDMANSLDKEVQTTVTAVVEKSEAMRIAAEKMLVKVADVEDETTAVASSSEVTSENVMTAAKAAEDLSASIAEITEEVTNSSQIAQAAVREAEAANQKIQGLVDSAQKVGEVVNLINDIAEQTNLLALNATIEAARAGEAGKGFAVVASEVKNLAHQTANATGEIGGQITEIQGAIKEAVGVIKSIGGTIEKTEKSASSIAGAVERQNIATQQIARNVDDAAAGTQDVSARIIGVSDATHETGSISKDVQQNAAAMSADIQSLQDRLTSILRESTAGNRRESERYTMTTKTTLNAHGRSMDITMKDISKTGAGIEPQVAFHLEMGDVVEINIPQFGVLKATIMRVLPTVIGMQFEQAQSMEGIAA
ncbi:MAG: methyl-accepting chemotaxis protein [Rhodospirillales bacterium]|nr:methyl-accepting chemotaxis protein [Rhodospirillales bacterium]